MSLLKKISKTSKPKVEKKPKKTVVGTKKSASKIKKKSVDKRNSKIIGMFGIQGTGKTKRALDSNSFGKILFLDSENKAHIIINEHYSDIDINLFSFRVNDNRGRISKLQTIKNFEKNTPKWIEMLKSGKYAVCIIDKCSLFRPYAKYEWLRRNPKRIRPLPTDWGEIEEIVQDLLYPFITFCRELNIHLIFTYDVKDHYIRDEVVGTIEDAKLWVLGELDVELWFERDYKVYCLKHPYKPFWQYRDQDENLFEYLFDREHINSEVVFKEYQQFKEETLTSEVFRKERKRARKQAKITVG